MPKIFVFGSNLAGRHGLGAAKYAREHHGAEYGVGEGRTGSAYAIPTKGLRLEVLPLDVIQLSCVKFVNYAIAHPEKEFELTRIGCGLAGYTNEQIAPFFRGVPDNVNVPPDWKPFLCPSTTGSSDAASTWDMNEPSDISTREP